MVKWQFYNSALQFRGSNQTTFENSDVKNSDPLRNSGHLKIQLL